MSFLRKCAESNETINKTQKTFSETSQMNHLPYTFPCLLHMRTNAKRISHLISEGYCRAGMTVEASIALPLFVFFILTMGSVMEMIRLHGCLERAMWNAGRRMAIYGCLQEETDLVTGILSDMWLQNEIQEVLEEDFFPGTVFGKDDLHLRVIRDVITVPEDCIRFRVNCTLNASIGLLTLPAMEIKCEYYGHLWNGYNLSNRREQDKEDFVYITPNGTVYHETPGCSYLKPAVVEVDAELVHMRRNEKGEKYRLCELCAGKRMPDKVYITLEGEAIHFDRTCHGIKRTVQAVSRDCVPDRLPCHRCAGENRNLLEK